MLVNPAFWAGILPFVLLASVTTMVGTVLLSRYWIRRQNTPSYGSILLLPFFSAFLVCLGELLWSACRYDGWEVFTLGYWEDAKGGLGDLIFPLVIFWFVSLFPAASIVIYYQKPHIDHRPQD